MKSHMDGTFGSPGKACVTAFGYLRIVGREKVCAANHIHPFPVVKVIVGNY